MRSALVIREPWIGLILAGKKTREMRSRANRVTGEIGLIRQGSGQVVGVARLVGSGQPLTRENYMDHRYRHAIPGDQLERVIANGWVHPWMLEDARSLAQPVPYQHKSGAVSFVTLEPSVIAAILRQLSDNGARAADPAPIARPVAPSTPIPDVAPAPAPVIPARSASTSDGSPVFVFRPETAQAYGRPLPDGCFVVLAGSTAMRNGSPKVKRDAAYRDQLVRAGVLVPDTDQRHYRFSQDHVFSSNSKAAGVIRDGNASGSSLWKDERTGRTLGDHKNAMRK